MSDASSCHLDGAWPWYIWCVRLVPLRYGKFKINPRRLKFSWGLVFLLFHLAQGNRVLYWNLGHAQCKSDLHWSYWGIEGQQGCLHDSVGPAEPQSMSPIHRLITSYSMTRTWDLSWCHIMIWHWNRRAWIERAAQGMSTCLWHFGRNEDRICFWPHLKLP